MHNLLSEIRYSTVKLTISVLTLFFLITLTTVFYNYYRLNSNYKKQVTFDAILVINEINRILDEFNPPMDAAIAESKSSSCDIQEYNLKRVVESSQWFRSLTVLHNGEIVCSSFFEPNQYNSDIVRYYTKQKLSLLSSKFLAPQMPIISYHIIRGDWSAFITMRASTFLNILSSTHLSNHGYLIINDDWINTQDQRLSNNQVINDNLLMFASDKYPFKIAFDLNTVTWSEKSIVSYFLLAIILFASFVISLLYIFLTAPRRNFQQALLRNELIPYYQPVISAADQKWCGVEVLARWQHPKKGLIMPGQFIGLAERSKLIIPMTKQLMKIVAENLLANINYLPNPFYIGFNIHSSHLQHHDLIDDCKSFLATFPPNTITLTIEIVESHFVDSTNNLPTLLNEFHKIGVTVAIDDFGTGYSNFGYLQKYKIDHLKIDKLFVSRICNTPSETHLIETIISLAKKLNMDLVAEGVETVEQLHYLTRQGVEFIQGFLFSKPVPLNEMLVLLTKPMKRIKPPMIIHQLSFDKKIVKII